MGNLQSLTAGNEFEIFVVLQLIHWNEGVPGDRWIVDHHSPAIEPDKTGMLWIAQVRGSKLNLRLVPVKPHAVSRTDLFPGYVLQSLQHLASRTSGASADLETC